MKDQRMLRYRRSTWLAPHAVFALGLALALSLGSGLPRLASAETVDEVVLVPDDKADWNPTNLFGWIRAGHNYGERSILVETSPPGATLDLFYVRSNFQKRYEQAEAPAKVILPPRIDAGERDALSVRAFLDGYRQNQASIRVLSKQDRLLIELEPLPNQLVAASHVYFSGRSSLAFLTKESLQVRVQQRDDGFNVILAETAKGTDVALDGIASPMIDRVESIQLGEDLLVRVDSPGGPEAGFEMRSRQSRDDLRDLYVYSVELIPADGGVVAVQRARAALAAIGPDDVGGCAAEFDRTLRSSLDASELSRALAPRGAFTDPYLRASMKRLGEISGGRVQMVDGSSFATASAIELAAAMSIPGQAKGFLALLRSLVDRLEPPAHRAATLRGLIAPEIDPAEFDELLRAAQSAERRCIGAGA